MTTTRSGGGTFRRVEMIRAELGMSPTEFARAIGLSPQRYARMMREGSMPQLIKLAAHGLAARRRFEPDQTFLVRIIGGLPSVMMLQQLHTTTIRGMLYALVPLVHSLSEAAEQAAPETVGQTRDSPAAGSRHKQIIDRVVGLLRSHRCDGGEQRPAELLDALEAEGGWFDQAQPRAQRLTYLTGILWHEQRRPDARLAVHQRGHYRLANGELAGDDDDDDLSEED